MGKANPREMPCLGSQPCHSLSHPWAHLFASWDERNILADRAGILGWKMLRKSQKFLCSDSGWALLSPGLLLSLLVCSAGPE